MKLMAKTPCYAIVYGKYVLADTYHVHFLFFSNSKVTTIINATPIKAKRILKIGFEFPGELLLEDISFVFRLRLDSFDSK